VRYIKLFESAGSRSELVATFLALLELVKSNRILVTGQGEDLQVTLAEGARRNREQKQTTGV